MRVESVFHGETHVLKVLLIGLGAMSLLSACATTTPQAPHQSASELAANTPAEPRRGPGQGCLTTGTRISLKDGECANVPGRVYSKDDLDRTGATTVSEALRMLDPAMTR
jgi:hypothetical protein